MGQRLTEAAMGIVFLLLAVQIALSDMLPAAVVLGAIGVALLWHQSRLGPETPVRHKREREPMRGPSEWGAAVGERISAAISASVRAAREDGIEAGFEELEEQIEQAIDPPRRPPEPSERPRPRKSGQLETLARDEAYAHAVDAARAAGLELSRTAVIPVDVGLIVYAADGERTLHRTTPVAYDAAYVQPFIQLNMPSRAVGLIRYELIDSDGQAVFIHEDHQSLERGVNLLTPSARLRTHSGLNRRGGWRLVVSADGVTLLDHGFTWGEDPRAQLRRHLHADGELTPEARTLLEDETSGPSVSLEDLLMEQEANPRSARQ